MTDNDTHKNRIFQEIKNMFAEKSVAEFIPGETYIPYAGRVYDEEEVINAVDACLDFWLTAGAYANTCEKEIAEFLQTDYCLLTNSGSSANLLAVSSLTSPQLGQKQLKPGDEVITTACGFPTTLNPIIQNNLTPVFIDVDLGTYNIQADWLDAAVSHKTKAIFVPHTLGNPADMRTIMKVARENDLWVIEDNCDALGSKYRGKYTGTFGQLATCSFYPAHHITMGEGGAIITANETLNRLVSSFRDWGRDCWCETGCDNSCGKRFSQQLGKLPCGYDHKYTYSHIGYNLKMTDIQAAIGVAQLKKLPEFIVKRRRNFDKLYKGLKQYEDNLILPQTTEDSEPSWFGFPITVRPESSMTRQYIVTTLEDNNVATRMLFGGNLLKQPAYLDIKYRLGQPLINTTRPLQNTDIVMNNMFWIGVYPGLTNEMLDYMLQTFDNLKWK
jgi:CDP-4-dehydro-6-deoxyglucose reductase, E1